MLVNLQEVTQNRFRWLVAAVLFSIVFDILWLVFGTSSTDAKGVEAGVRKFGSVISVASFLTRLLMMLVYWKDSLDFDNIMLGKKVDQALRTVSN